MLKVLCVLKPAPCPPDASNYTQVSISGTSNAPYWVDCRLKSISDCNPLKSSVENHIFKPEQGLTRAWLDSFIRNLSVYFFLPPAQSHEMTAQTFGFFKNKLFFLNIHHLTFKPSQTINKKIKLGKIIRKLTTYLIPMLCWRYPALSVIPTWRPHGLSTNLRLSLWHINMDESPSPPT